MKKPSHKLSLNKETLRRLASVELARAVGGETPFDSGTLCPAKAAVPSAVPADCSPGG
jgi:hypothetical protein